MLIPSRRLMFGLALGGCFAGSTAFAQDDLFSQDGFRILGTGAEPRPAPAYSESAAPEPISQFTEFAPIPSPTVAGEIPVSQSIPAIVRISDKRPEEQIGHAQYEPPRKKRRLHAVAPHKGWTQPGRLPIQRSWVPYHKFFPNSWTGTPNNAAPTRRPMVYMPTDTTQLGYYYQHVPHWHAYRGMTPPSRVRSTGTSRIRRRAWLPP